MLEELVVALDFSERLPPLGLSEEVDVGASVLRADTVAATAGGIARIGVASFNSYGDWVDGIATVGNGLASVSD